MTKNFKAFPESVTKIGALHTPDCPRCGTSLTLMDYKRQEFLLVCNDCDFRSFDIIEAFMARKDSSPD